MNNLMSTKPLAFSFVMYALLSFFTVSADVNKRVLQVDASLSIAQQVEFENAPFVLLEGEPSTLAEEGLGGYKVELIAQMDSDQSYILHSKIYNYTKSGYNLLGAESIKLQYQSLGKVAFESKAFGSVLLQLKIVRQAEMPMDTENFGESVR